MGCQHGQFFHQCGTSLPGSLLSPGYIVFSAVPSIAHSCKLPQVITGMRWQYKSHALLCLLILAKWGMLKGQTTSATPQAPVNSYSHLSSWPSSWACSPSPVLTAKEPYCGHSDYQVKLVTKIWACGNLPLPHRLCGLHGLWQFHHNPQKRSVRDDA